MEEPPLEFDSAVAGSYRQAPEERRLEERAHLLAVARKPA
jgi:hypothetical protein